MKKMMRIMEIKNNKYHSHKKMMNQVEKRHPNKKSQDNNQIESFLHNYSKCDQQNPKISPLYVFPTTLGPALEGLSPLPFYM